MRTARTLSTLLLGATFLLGPTGCIKSTLLKGQIQGTREGSSAVDTLHDVEVARYAAYAGLAQFEGMHKLAPGNEDALFLLTKGWSGATFAFTEDDMELAEDHRNKEMAEYHKQRAAAGYERAVAYGLELIGKRDKGFQDARKNDATLRSWLKTNFADKEDAANLFWLGYAWLAKTNINKDDPETVADLFVAVAIIERSVELDETYAFGNGLTALAAYHARTAQGELDESKRLFDKAIALTQGRSLIQKFNYATKYLCARGDKDGYVKALQEIIAAGDTMPEQRLTNALAKRRARRYLSKHRMEEARENCGFADSKVGPAPEPPPEADLPRRALLRFADPDVKPRVPPHPPRGFPMSMLRKASSVALLAAAFAVVAQPSRADGEKEIKVGTLAPKSSPWGKVFQIWQDAVAEQSNGNMKVTFYWNGSQGDEVAMVDKMLGGSQLDAVAATAVGLSKIWRPILALQSPGLFRTWGALDTARDSMMADITSNFAAKGVIHLGSGDVGIAHIMSKGFEVHGPESLQGKSPYMWTDDAIAPVLYRTIGGVTPKPLSVPAVLPALNSGSVDVVNAPALAAQQLQWASKLDNVVEQASGIGIGALIMKKSTLDDLSEDQRKIIMDTGAVAAKGLTDRIRKADAHAFNGIKKKMTVTTLTAEEQAKWEDVFTKTREALKQGVFDAGLITKLEGMKG